MASTMPNASLEIHLKFLVTTKTAVNTMPGSEDYIANHALLTMGGRILHFEGEIKNGVLEIDHTFKYIQDTDEESYHNQMKWTKAVRKVPVFCTGIEYLEFCVWNSGTTP